jgi:hypothetical protein
MKICPGHNGRLRRVLPDDEALYQCQSLITLNIANSFPELLGAPPTVCPLCHLDPEHAAAWMNQAVASIRHERRATS